MVLREEKSVAAVVYNKKQYLLLKYELGHWEFVKGHIEQGETERETVMRELKEETGITDASIIDGFKEKYDYFFASSGNKIHKYVTCYLIKANTKKVSLSYEHVDYNWLPFKPAKEQLTYKNAKNILTKAHNFRNLTSS
ncbi:MAG: NUDIX domain-containing protein [Promethearchaeota archaeon]|nr:MAG: NUDIX domain-containing protein [Candidatus Lokiarchaeota archaeon]